MMLRFLVVYFVTSDEPQKYVIFSYNETMYMSVISEISS